MPLLPLGPRVAVARDPAARTLDSGIVLPYEDARHSHAGRVLAVGQPHEIGDKRLPLDVEIGQRVLYSSRVDTFETDDGILDVVEEASIIGVMP